MSYNARRAPSGPRRGQERIASGARTAPYARPETSRMASSGSWKEDNQGASASKQWPPNQLSIRGASGPTWITVANLLRGTTEADIHETFQQFGDIEDIKLRKPPSENHPSIAFEIAFTSRAAATVAVEKLDGALADGRLLQVTLRDPKYANPLQPSHSPAIETPPVLAAPAPTRELLPTIPSGPRALQRPNANNGRELLQPKSQASVAVKPQQPNGPSKRPAAASLQSRLMSAAELKTLQKRQAKTMAAKSFPGIPTGPRGAIASPSSSHSTSLAKRITMPLAMRLSEEAKKNRPAGSPSVNKKRKAKAKARANGMDVD